MTIADWCGVSRSHRPVREACHLVTTPAADSEHRTQFCQSSCPATDFVNTQARLQTPCSIAGTQRLAGHRLQPSSIKTRDRPPTSRAASPIESTNREWREYEQSPSRAAAAA